MQKDPASLLGQDIVEAFASFAAIENTKCIASDGCLTLLSGIDFAPVNWSLLTSPMPPLPQSTLERATAPFAQHRLPGVVLSFPPWRDECLSPNFTPSGKLPLMTIDLDASPRLFESVPNGVETKVITQPHELQAWLNIFESAFSYPNEAVAFFGKIFGSCPGWEYQLAMIDQEPVGCGSLFFGKRVAGCFSLATAKKARGRGVGRALTKFRCEQAKSRGYHTAVLLASPDGAKCFPRWGFEKQFDVTVHVHDTRTA